ncbi:diadenylate cyclase [Rossellomorea sp. y25]|uniref:diadenylate cyclase n=1 Tax=Rossellomorea sp. y25 TaxID=3118174 RepID=UPI0030E10164
MDTQIFSYLVNYISDVIGVSSDRIYIIEEETNIVFGSEDFNIRRIKYRSYDFIKAEIPYTNYAVYIDISKTAKHYRNQRIRSFIKHACIAANEVQNIILKFPSIDSNEVVDLIKRLSIPAVLQEFYSESTNRIARSITDARSIDYGKIIREVLRWGNSSIEGREIHTGIIIGDNLLKIESTLRASTIKGQFEIINLKSKPLLTDFKEIKPLLEIADGLYTFLICEPVEDNNFMISGILITETGLMSSVIGESNKGFNAPVFSLREMGLRIGRGNELIMEYINNTPRIRNYKELTNILREFMKIKVEDVNKLTAIILEISHMGKGASIVFNFNENYFDDVEKTQWIKPTKIQFSGEKVFVDTFSNFTKTDGAVLINSNNEIIGFGSILKPTKAKAKISGGSRHKSMASFSHNKEILGIVISEDGPISIIKNNSIIFRL